MIRKSFSTVDDGAEAQSTHDGRWCQVCNRVVRDEHWCRVRPPTETELQLKVFGPEIAFDGWSAEFMQDDVTP